MKKGIAGAILAGLALRLAVAAGAGEVVGDWIRGISGSEKLVSATLDITLGGRAGDEPGTDSPAPAADLTAERQSGAVSYTVEEALPMLLWEPAAEESAPEPEPDAPEILPADLSAAATVNNRTSLPLDLAALAAEGLSLRLPAGQPQILIVHTHSSEAYTPDDLDRYEASDPYRTEDKSYSVIRVGDALAEKLAQYGLNVLHDREIYDYPSYTGSYGRSGAAVERYLREYPGIRVVLDLHRDAIGSGDVIYKTHADVSGRASAQVMLLAGTGENGLSHPNWRENLKLALLLQNAVDARYPSLMRPVELVSERYNQQLSTGSLIVEVGSSGNTLREALTAVSLFGDAVGPALAALVE